MNILIIGSGGREHALGWKIRQSKKVEKIYFAPGNGGTLEIGENIPATTNEEILSFSLESKIDLIVVAPDNYLADGLVDLLEQNSIRAFGPTKTAAKLEWSKSYAKEFMKKYQIPTASAETFSDIDKAKEYIKIVDFPQVIKADGLALGKGVIIVQDKKEAEEALDLMMGKKKFGSSGDTILIEEFMEGVEVSAHAFCDGKIAKMFPLAQDRKRAYENDEGPNTGGMGTISPVPGIGEDIVLQIHEQILIPVMKGMKKEGSPFKGILFPGIMLTKDGPKVIEFNTRFGDPETQSYVHLMKNDLVEAMEACIEGRLEEFNMEWKGDTACCVILASEGYPGEYEKEKKIFFGELDDDIVLFHAGTKKKDEEVISSGGRVLGVTTMGRNLGETLKKTYEAVEEIDFENKFYRKDIGSSKYY